MWTHTERDWREEEEGSVGGEKYFDDNLKRTTDKMKMFPEDARLQWSQTRRKPQAPTAWAMFNKQ